MLLGWTAPGGIEMCHHEVVETHGRRPSVDEIKRIGMDTSKHVLSFME
jgi:hypothetical protein